MELTIDDGSVRWLVIAIVSAVAALHLVSRVSVAVSSRRARRALGVGACRMREG
jgi:hypothetical protein